MAPSRHDWKIVDWDVKPQHNQPTILIVWALILAIGRILLLLMSSPLAGLDIV